MSQRNNAEREKWVVHFDITKEYHAGNKYENDVIEIFCKCGFRVLRYGKQKIKKIGKLYFLILFCIYFLFNVRKNSIVFFLAPFKTPYDKAFRILAKIKQANIYAFIIDINGLRGGEFLKKELDNLMFTKGIVVQNDIQKKFLRNKGYSGDIQVMGVLDFLDESKLVKRQETDLALNLICYGGNLSYNQSGFLYKWVRNVENTKLKVLVYGINLEETIDNSVFFYMGNYPPNQIVQKLEGSFGLVWNGTETKTCGGNCGEYYKYASPHKLSMYIAAGIPVIVWKNSAMKKFVEDNGIGFAVSSLEDIEKRIISMPLYEYKQILSNVYKLRKNIIEGYYAETSIKQLLDNER